MRLRTQCATVDDWVLGDAGAAHVQDFGDRTSLVNALRNRRIYANASLRLLSDLVEVSRGSARRGNGPAGDMLDADYHLVRTAAASSPCLLASLVLGRRLARLRRRLEAQTLLLCRQDGLDVPLDALALVLAAAIARQFGEAAAAVTFADGRATADIWLGADHAGAHVVSSIDALVERVRGAAQSCDEPPPLAHVIVAADAGVRQLPRPFASLARRPIEGAADRGFDRIVYVADRLPDQAPEELVRLLAKAVRQPHGTHVGSGGPFFCSFIPSIVSSKRSGRAQAFATIPVDEEFQTPALQRRMQRGWRLERDRCVIPFDLVDLRRRWQDATAATPEPGGGARRGRTSPVPAATHAEFAATCLSEKAIREAAYRWARAVTNRQVGVALSGGGAASYRLVPLMQGLDANQVPIDVVSGVSGGALVGAYYCSAGDKGLDRCLDHGWLMQILLAVAGLDSSVYRRTVDMDLGSRRVEQMSPRFVALATVLREKSPPEAHVVTAGTLGEAVQASGAAPLLFAPTEQGARGETRRFADGATAALIPARILKDWGADVVFAFNCLPGPPRSNPFDWMPLGRLAYRYTFGGRFIDLWVAAGYLMQRIGRETNEDAQVYYEPDPEPAFLLDSFVFARAAGVAEAAAQTAKLKECVAHCVRYWEVFRQWRR